MLLLFLFSGGKETLLFRLSTLLVKLFCFVLMLVTTFSTFSQLFSLFISDLFQRLGNSQKEYKKCITFFSIKNQLRFRGNLGMYPWSTSTP